MKIRKMLVPLLTSALVFSFVGVTSAEDPAVFTDVELSIEGGELKFESVPNVNSFGTVQLTPDIQTVTTGFDGDVRVTDARGTGEGWRMQVQATQFQEVEPAGGFVGGTSALTLPVGSLSIAPVESIMQVSSGTTVLPTSAISSDQVIDNGSAVTVVSAGTDEGMGMFDITFPTDALLLVLDPAVKMVDVVNYNGQPTPYKSTLTFTLVTGP